MSECECKKFESDNPKSFSNHKRWCEGKMQTSRLWKGDEVGYNALHLWVRSRLVRPRICPNCQRTKRLDLANISQKYKRDLTDWEWLCRRCHMKKDGRLEKAIAQLPHRGGPSKAPMFKTCENCKISFKRYNGLLKQRFCDRECYDTFRQPVSK